MIKLRDGYYVLVIYIGLILIIFPALVLAKIGVGVGVGKIQVDSNLKAGQIHLLPNLPVLNTGDVETNYEVSIEFHEGIPQLRPQRDWFDFSPKTFTLQPGAIQNVEVKVTLPVKVQPGEYFAYLEAHPAKSSTSGVTAIGIAAATKLYFTVEAANLFQGLYYRFLTILSTYFPWPQISFGLIILVSFILILRKYIAFNIGIKIKKNEK